MEGAFLRPEKGLRTERPRLAQICEGHKEPDTWVEDAFYYDVGLRPEGTL